MCGQHNVKATTRDNTGQNTKDTNTPKPRIEIKISGSAVNRTRASGLEARDLRTMPWRRTITYSIGTK